MTPLDIKPPFANYHRAKLERLVREAFEGIEQRAAATPRHGFDQLLQALPMDPADFQVLVAAEYYLRTTAQCYGRAEIISQRPVSADDGDIEVRLDTMSEDQRDALTAYCATKDGS